MSKRLDLALKGKGSNEAIAQALKERTGYETSGEKIRKARRGEGQTIAHDLVAAVAWTFDLNVAELLYGERDGLAGDVPRLPEHSPTADDRAFFEEIKSILRDQEIAPGMRVLLIDAATSAWTKAALYRGEVAGEERAKAVHQAELTQAARTEAVREVERNATDRLRFLQPESDAVAAALPPLRPPPEPQRGGAKKGRERA